MSAKPVSSKSSCCSCFGQKKEKKDKLPSTHLQKHAQARFHSYRPTDMNQMISHQIDQKAKKEAETAADIFKKTEK